MTEGLRVGGIDSSTQSTKVVLVRASDGAVVDQASAPHPPGTAVDPMLWWAALRKAGAALLARAAAIGVGASQLAMVALDAAGAVVRPAPLCNDLRVGVPDRRGGQASRCPQECAGLIGSVPAASFTVTKLRWMAPSTNRRMRPGRARFFTLPTDRELSHCRMTGSTGCWTAARARPRN